MTKASTKDLGVVQAKGACITCEVYQEQVQYLRARVADLENKMMSMVPEAAQAYQRTRLMEVTSARPEVGDGLVPLVGMIDDEEKQFSDWVDSFHVKGQ